VKRRGRSLLLKAAGEVLEPSPTAAAAAGVWCVTSSVPVLLPPADSFAAASILILLVGTGTGPAAASVSVASASGCRLPFSTAINDGTALPANKSPIAGLGFTPLL